jgi:ABC-type polysaccharide/polyol phosphate transport system ATPase subunit
VNVVEFRNVSKSYAIYQSPGDRLKELFSFSRGKRHTDFWALRDITFDVRRGESTLLQIVALSLSQRPQFTRADSLTVFFAPAV